MRGTALIIAIFAIIACGIGSLQADATPTPRGQAVGSPQVASGERCETVRSNARASAGAIPAGTIPTGTICVYLVGQGRAIRGGVSFTAHSGLLKTASVKVLQLTVNNHVVLKADNVSETVLASAGLHLFSWWDEPAYILSKPNYVQVGVYKACMIWKSGGEACTGPGWLYSARVKA